MILVNVFSMSPQEAARPMSHYRPGRLPLRAAVPRAKPHVVAGQFHDAKDDVITIRPENARLFFDHNGIAGATLALDLASATMARGGATAWTAWRQRVCDLRGRGSPGAHSCGR
jgi:hypothetical protein